MTRPTPPWPRNKVHDTEGSGIFVHDGGPGKLAKNVARARNTE